MSSNEYTADSNVSAKGRERSLPKLTDANYARWARRLGTHLKSRSLFFEYVVSDRTADRQGHSRDLNGGENDHKDDGLPPRTPVHPTDEFVRYADGSQQPVFPRADTLASLNHRRQTIGAARDSFMSSGLPSTPRTPANQQNQPPAGYKPPPFDEAKCAEALDVITSTLSYDQEMLVSHIESPWETWSYLKEWHTQNGQQGIEILEQKLDSEKYRDGKMVKFLVNMKRHRLDLRNAGKEITEATFIRKVLKQLPWKEFRYWKNMYGSETFLRQQDCNHTLLFNDLKTAVLETDHIVGQPDEDDDEPRQDEQMNQDEDRAQHARGKRNTKRGTERQRDNFTNHTSEYANAVTMGAGEEDR